MKKQITIAIIGIACFATQNLKGQILTPGGVIQGSSSNNHVGIGLPALSVPTNKLIVNDNIQTPGGLMKLVNDNGQANDKWWIGFSHGTNTNDNMDRARIGVEIANGGAGSLFFETGAAWGGQAERMRIDEFGKVDIFGDAQIGGSTGIGIAPSPSRNLKINSTYSLNMPLSSGVGLEVNSPDPTNAGSAALIVGGGVTGIFESVENPGATSTGMNLYVGNATEATGIEISCKQGSAKNTGVTIDVGGLSSPVCYGVKSYAHGSLQNFGIYSEAVHGGLASYAGYFRRADAIGGLNQAKAGGFEGNVDITNNVLQNTFTDYGLNTTITGNPNGTSQIHAGKFTAQNAATSYGLEVNASSNVLNAVNTYGVHTTASSDKATNYGVKSTASFSGNVPGIINYGIHTQATSTFNSTTNYGIYATITNGVAGQPNGVGSFAGYFAGNTYSTGAYWGSDAKLKRDVTDYTNGLEKIMQLNPKSYYFKTDEYKRMNLRDGEQIGFIAQELEKVFPNLVKNAKEPGVYDEDGKVIEEAIDFKAVDYVTLIPVLVSDIQEQQSIIETQNAKISELEDRLKKLEQNGTTGIGTGDNHSTVGAALFQNAPNPFGSNTEIRYRLPEQYSDAKIMVFDMNGKQVRTVALQGAGEGSTNFSSGELAVGMYMYSLVIDGQEIDTKRMILSGK